MFVAITILTLAFFAWGVELLAPGRHWAKVPGWIGRVIFLNGFQAFIIWGEGKYLDTFLVKHRWFSLDTHLSSAWCIFIGYITLTYFYYWWHRARHKSDILWLGMHQIHHSPTRIEVITAFYKHPFELIGNGFLVSFVCYILCGLSLHQTMWVVVIAGVAELFYHWNVKTPKWVGYIIQRPEQHDVHHERFRHNKNYGDLPIWDWLHGTYENPREFTSECGFGPELELRFKDMLLCRDVGGQDVRPVAKESK